MFDKHPLLENLLLAAYERDGWDAEALAIWQRRFDERPVPEHYRGLMKAAAAAKADSTASKVDSVNGEVGAVKTDLAGTMAGLIAV